MKASTAAERQTTDEAPSIVGVAPAQKGVVKRRIPAAWLSYDDLAAELAVSKNTVINYVKQGILPQPRKLGPRVVRFSRQSLDEWRSKLGEVSAEGATYG